jgi:hypothetical protein
MVYSQSLAVPTAMPCPTMVPTTSATATQQTRQTATSWGQVSAVIAPTIAQNPIRRVGQKG